MLLFAGAKYLRDKYKDRRSAAHSDIIVTPTPSYPGSHIDIPLVKPSDYVGSEVALATVLPAENRGIRTPSPTPYEARALNPPPKSFRDRFFLHKKYIPHWIVYIVVLGASIVFSKYQQQIVHALRPAITRLHSLPAGWLIPIVIMIALSFPPLFGHEIVGMLVGIVWGLGIGFGIVAAGTVLGELCTFYAFKGWCAPRARKWEATKIPYACLAKVVRDGGLPIVTLVRYSALPGHFSTAVFSTCGVNVWIFLIGAILALPYQLALVYTGVAIGLSDQLGDGRTSAQEYGIEYGMLAVVVVCSMAASRVLRWKMEKAVPEVVYQRRKARQAKMLAEVSGSPSLVEEGNAYIVA